MKQTRIRPLAVGIFTKGDTILVFEGYDHVKDEVFYRPLGGGIEFGEPGHEALAREIREELGAEITAVRHLATVENIFTCNGQAGHEIVLLYAAKFADPAIYEQPVLEGREDNGAPFKALWMPLSAFAGGTPPLYPDALLELLASGALPL